MTPATWHRGHGKSVALELQVALEAAKDVKPRVGLT